jgi:hypothetical protein
MLSEIVITHSFESAEDKRRVIVNRYTDALQACRDISSIKMYINTDLISVTSDNPEFLAHFREFCSRVKPFPVTWEDKEG